MDFKYMEQAVELAREGLGSVSPNPCVGAVVVKDGKVIGKGFHAQFGGPHAEVSAIEGVDCNGADLYVTLEPCCHTGKTPPCTDLIIQSGIKRVFCGMKDPFPQVDGGGLIALKEAGVEVFIVEDRDDAVRKLYQSYIKGFSLGLPHVTLKAGLSLDGKIALKSGESKWITSKLSRDDARKERGFCDAVLVGSGTVAADDPHLASPSGENLLRVVIDRKLSLEPTMDVFRDENVFVATTDMAKSPRVDLYRSSNINFGVFGNESVDLIALLKALFDLGVRSVFVEGGAKIHSLFLDTYFKGDKVVDRLLFYYAPLFLGSDGIGVTNMLGPDKLSETMKFYSTSSTVIGDDVKIEAVVELL